MKHVLSQQASYCLKCKNSKANASIYLHRSLNRHWATMFLHKYGKCCSKIPSGEQLKSGKTASELIHKQTIDHGIKERWEQQYERFWRVTFCVRWYFSTDKLERSTQINTYRSEIFDAIISASNIPQLCVQRRPINLRTFSRLGCNTENVLCTALLWWSYPTFRGSSHVRPILWSTAAGYATYYFDFPANQYHNYKFTSAIRTNSTHFA